MDVNDQCATPIGPKARRSRPPPDSGSPAGAPGGHKLTLSVQMGVLLQPGRAGQRGAPTVNPISKKEAGKGGEITVSGQGLGGARRC
ncbi:hypothetical protein SCALM49S_03516 [Streptomyces californicus]